MLRLQGLVPTRTALRLLLLSVLDHGLRIQDRASTHHSGSTPNRHAAERLPSSRQHLIHLPLELGEAVRALDGENLVFGDCHGLSIYQVAIPVDKYSPTVKTPLIYIYCQK